MCPSELALHCTSCIVTRPQQTGNTIGRVTTLMVAFCLPIIVDNGTPGLAAPDPTFITIILPESCLDVAMVKLLNRWDRRQATLRYTGGAAYCVCHQMVAAAKLGLCLKKCHIVSSTPARRPSIYIFSWCLTCMV